MQKVDIFHPLYFCGKLQQLLCFWLQKVNLKKLLASYKDHIASFTKPDHCDITRVKLRIFRGGWNYHHINVDYSITLSLNRGGLWWSGQDTTLAAEGRIF